METCLGALKIGTLTKRLAVGLNMALAWPEVDTHAGTARADAHVTLLAVASTDTALHGLRPAQAPTNACLVTGHSRRREASPHDFGPFAHACNIIVNMVPRVQISHSSSAVRLHTHTPSGEEDIPKQLQPKEKTLAHVSRDQDSTTNAASKATPFILQQSVAAPSTRTLARMML